MTRNSYFWHCRWRRGRSDGHRDGPTVASVSLFAGMGPGGPARARRRTASANFKFSMRVRTLLNASSLSAVGVQVCLCRSSRKSAGCCPRLRCRAIIEREGEREKEKERERARGGGGAAVRARAPASPQCSTAYTINHSTQRTRGAGGQLERGQGRLKGPSRMQGRDRERGREKPGGAAGNLKADYQPCLAAGSLEGGLPGPAFGTMVENCSSGLLGWFAVRGNPSSLFRLVSKIIK